MTQPRKLIRKRGPFYLFWIFCLAFLLTIAQGSFRPLSVVAVEPEISLDGHRLDTTTQSLAQAIPSAQRQGTDYYNAGQFSEAAEIWEQVAKTFQEQGDLLNQASILSNLALVYQQMNQIDRSQASIAQALEILGQFSKSSSTASIFAQVYNNQGNLLLWRSQPAQAFTAFTQATESYTQGGNNLGILQSQINQAQALQALGFYRRARLLLTEFPPEVTAQIEPVTQVTIFQLLGDLYRAEGDLKASKSSLESGLTLAQKLVSQGVSQSQKIAQLKLSLGHTTEARGQLEDALTHYQGIATITNDPHLILRAKIGQLHILETKLASVDADSDPNSTALAAEIQASLEHLPTDRLTLNIRLDLARQQLELTHLPQKAIDNIVQNLGIAVQQAKDLGALRGESNALGYLGKLYEKQGQLEESQVAFQKALRLANTAGAREIAYQWQRKLGQLAQQKEDRNRAILHYSEAVNNLQKLRTNLIAIAPDLRFNFKEKVEPVYRELVDLRLATAADSSQTSQDERQKQLKAARLDIEALQLAEVENFFQEPCVKLSKELDKIIENESAPTGVIYPIILPDRLEIILKLPGEDTLQQFTAQVSQIDLEELLEQLQEHLQGRYDLRDAQDEAAHLYDWLIRPMKPALANSQIDTLVFVLDGFLRSIPMAALYDGQREQYLIEDYSIALAPGLQLVDPEPLYNQRLSSLIAGLSEARHDFAPLPSVETEVLQVKNNVNSDVLLNKEFTETNLITAINNTSHPLVHLATHGQFSSDPEETFVLAWDKRIQVNTLNRLLRQSEQSRQKSIELLILSACETAGGDKRAALGLAGVAVQAGARSTLASLWKLDDNSGALFSEYFYQALKTPGISKAQAVRQAQLKLLRTSPDSSTKSYRHPRYWAPYILLGNWL